MQISFNYLIFDYILSDFHKDIVSTEKAIDITTLYIFFTNILANIIVLHI